MTTQEKIKVELKNVNPWIKQNTVNKKNIKSETKSICKNCGVEFVFKPNKIFCSPNCACEYKHKEAYEYFLKYPEQFCRGNYTPKAFKKDFLKEQNGVCAICKCEPFHNGQPLTFILDHIDGDASNNKRDNLRMICPNCDSQLDTYKSKNKHSTRRNYWKEHIINNITRKTTQTGEEDALEKH